MSSPTSESMHIAGVIGDPVEHSRSPAMHNAAFAALGLAARYERWHTPAAALAERVESLRSPMMLGANVTLPHKIAVVSLVDRCDPAVQLIGAANTIIRQPDGSLTAANTDAPAVIATLREDAQFDPAGRRVVILGASGAARAAVFALMQAGAARICLVNRTIARAEDLLADLLEQTDTEMALAALTPDQEELEQELAEADLLVNATSLGWQADEIPIEAERIPPQALVFDMVYKPTRLLREAAARGAPTLGGKGMLVRQAGLAFEHWTGRPAPIDVMMQAFDHDQR
jgi:shikimate dehydrogenase